MPTTDRSAPIKALFTPRPLEQLCCVNPACPQAGVYSGDHLSVCPTKGSGRYRILRCACCQSEFSERKGTALWGSRMAEDKILAIAHHLQEGCGIRRTARLVGVSKDGVTSIALRLGLHAKQFHDQQAQNLVVREAQLDEKWSFVQKKEKHCDPSDPADADKGDQWDCLAVDVPSRFVVSVQIGKRTPQTLQRLVWDFAERTNGVPPDLITTDGYQSYPPLLMNQYGVWMEPPRTGRPGRPRQGYLEWPTGSVYATVTKTYKEGKVVGVRRDLIFGTQQELEAALEASPVSQQINTAFVERQNGTDRGRNPRKARKTYSFSKDLLMHLAVSWWVVTCYNFHDLHRSLRQPLPDGKYQPRTPAMAIGLQTRPLSIEDLMRTQLVGRVSRLRPTPAAFRYSVEDGP